MPLPDFIIIGAMKAGTSTLHSNLQLHPEIGMSRLKEPQYFSKYYDRPINWYKDQFDNSKRINGESTPAYSWNHFYPEVPERIKKTLPSAKLIYVLRDPIDRIISHLHHDLYRDRFKIENVNDVVLQDLQYISTSKYFFQVSKYLEYFKPEDIHYVDTSSLKEDLNNTLNDICLFLGSSEYEFSTEAKVRNQSSNKYLIKNYDLIHKYLPRKAANLYHWLFYFIRIKIERPLLSPEVMQKIKKELQDDVENLKVLTNKDFESWKTYNKISLH